MKKFKNTFGVKGSTHAINHFAELAVKEGWKEQSRKIPTNLYFSSQEAYSLSGLQKNHFWFPDSIGNNGIDINTLEGWNKALELMKEVEEENKYDFVCPHSGEGFMYGDEHYRVYCVQLDDKPTNSIISHEHIKHNCSENIAIFHTAEDALKWNRDKFGVKEGEHCKKCGNTGRCLPQTLDSPDGQECDCLKVNSNNITILQENGTYNIVISKEIKDKVVIKFD